ncbi:DUF2785 domain-containing protein [Lysinibacillus sp. NPDC097231]|uniref:DUF2785 domain-containing protein n=1 Tax=Lysinibacillus sp. NPDC097231 TaxID=3364142 RepID=UPI0038283449
MLLNDILREDELKDRLQALEKGQATLEQENQEQLLHSMLAHIGSTNSELRDNLIYGSFYDWILEKNLLDHSRLTELLDFSMNNLLCKGIEERESDLVFTRTFTSLLLALILFRDHQDDFLSQHKLDDCKDKLLAYLAAEKDVRGYVTGKGWAHSVAHVSDAIDELVKNPKISKETYVDFLHALWNMILRNDYVFIHNEDERLLVPILTMLEHGLEQQEIIQLLLQIPITLMTQKSQLDLEHYRIILFNCKTLLKSFYIQTNGKLQYATLHQSIATCLSEL